MVRHFSFEGHCYHVTSATQGRRPVFADTAAAQVLENAFHFIRQERAFILAYAIMPDHFHALIVPRGDFSLSQLMQSVKGFVAREINAATDERGPLWQRGFYDRGIRNDEQLLATIEYIHENPVKEGLANTAKEYRFSSAWPSAKTDLETFFA